jgi:hypothetical protein
LSRHISRAERWNKTDRKEEYVSEFGVVHKDRYGGNVWVGLVKDGFGTRVVGRGYKRARNAMIAVEEAAKAIKEKGSPLPPIRFPAHIFEV